MATLSKKLVKAALPELFINKDVLIDGKRVALTSVTFSDKKGESGKRVSACVYAHIAQSEPTPSVTNVSRKITYPSGAWIEINYQNEQYTVSREHGVGAILEEMAKMILGGFEGCRKFVELESKVNAPVATMSDLMTDLRAEGEVLQFPSLIVISQKQFKIVSKWIKNNRYYQWKNTIFETKNWSFESSIMSKKVAVHH